MLQAGDLLLQLPGQGAAMAGNRASMPWLLPLADRAQRLTQAAAGRRPPPPSEGFPAGDTPEQRKLRQMAAERLAREQQRRGEVPQWPSQGKVEPSSTAPRQQPEAAARLWQQAGTPAADPSQEQQEAARRAEEDLEQEKVPEPPRMFQPATDPCNAEPSCTGGRRPGRVSSALQLQASQRTSGRPVRLVNAGEGSLRRTTSQGRVSAPGSGRAVLRRGQHVTSNSKSEAMDEAMKKQLKQEEEQRVREEAKQRSRRRTRKAVTQAEDDYLMPVGTQPAPPTVQVRSTP